MEHEKVYSFGAWKCWFNWFNWIQQNPLKNYFLINCILDNKKTLRVFFKSFLSHYYWTQCLFLVCSLGRVNFGEKTKNIIFLKTVVKNHEIYVFLSHRNHPNNSESTITVVHLALKIVKEIRKIYKGKCCPSAFFIFFFEKNISDGFEARDCVPEA